MTEVQDAPKIACICCDGDGYHDEEPQDCDGVLDEEDDIWECGVCDGEGTLPA